MINKTSLYIATTLDGFISSEDGSVDFLDPFNDLGEDFGYFEFLSTIDSIVMGNSTYQQFGGTEEFDKMYEGKPIYVFSRSAHENKDNVTFVNEDVVEFSKKLKGHTWMLGGAGIFNEFYNKNLVDKFIITVMPVVLGSGIRLFGEKALSKELELIKNKSYDSGVVQLTYKIKNK